MEEAATSRLGRPPTSRRGPDAGGRGWSNPHEAAQALGVSPSGLRRLAEIYAGVCGELPRDPKTRSRLWPEAAVAELAAARRLVLSNRASSIREALEAIRSGEELPLSGDSRPFGRGGGELLSVLRDEIAAVREEMTAVLGEIAKARDEVEALRDEVLVARVALSRLGLPVPAPAQPAENVGVPASGRQGEPDRAELHQLRRRLRYLEAELEAREL